MTTTTALGTWYNALGGQTLGGPSGYVTDSLGEYGADFDVDGLTAAFVRRVNAALPSELLLAGDQVYSAVEYSGDWRQALRDAVEGIDFWELADQYDRS